MKAVRACVVGSTNVDLVLGVPALPAPGETVLSDRDARREPGGKGGNQAVALARLGAQVRFVSAVGNDPEGWWSRAQLAEAGVDVTDVATVEAPTGVAVVMVDTAGENCIVVSPGANAHVAPPEQLDADVLLLSLEVPLATAAAAAATARRLAVPVVLNAAPAQPLPATLLADVDVLVVNESEWADLGNPAVPAVVVTRGARGCVVVAGHRTWELAAVPVEDVVDTTGAGDCFAAALAWGVAQGFGLDDAARFASRAAALSVTAPGARAGLPTHDEVLQRTTPPSSW
ncbi:MAG TPA: ribokinase [Mycobacteriales bacterium]|nr:ribokinase [Mycobacteriales bacterium]